MAASNYSACLDIELVYEGGKSTDPKDPGNWTGGKVGVGTLGGTNFGIASADHPGINVMALTKEEAGEILKKGYWDPINGDNLAAGLDLAVFAPSINSGPSRAKAWYAKTSGMTTDEAISKMFSLRLSFLHALTTWLAFGKGWGTRCAGEEAKAHAMVVGATPDIIASKALVQSDKASTAKTQAATIAVTSAVVAIGTTAATGTIAPSVAIVSVGWFASVVRWFNSWRHSQRADALTSATMVVEASKQP